MNFLKRFWIVLFVFFAFELAEGYEKLTQEAYEKGKNEKAVILYGVNWGRQWGCAGFDNAQLRKITFSRIDSFSDSFSQEDIEINVPVKLFTENVSESYAIVASPGKYVLTEFDIKIARFSNNVTHLKATKEDLFQNGQLVDGTFNVGAGEIIYIGDFGLDCISNNPILWRYYIQEGDFQSYVDGFKKKYKFIGDKKVIYRLFETNKFGQPPQNVSR